MQFGAGDWFLITIRNKLKAIRRATGDAFSASKGYDARKPLSYRRRKTIEKYYEKLVELTSSPHKVFTPPKGWKNETFSYTTQNGFPRFKQAYIHTIDESASYEYALQRDRPRGSRFVVRNRTTGQEFYHIPATAFLSYNGPIDADFAEWLEEVQGEEISELDDVSYYEYVLEYYGADAEFYLIQAGESYVWGSGGGKRKCAEKIALILENYDDTLFASNSESRVSHWFRGVTAFTDRFSILPRMGAAIKKRAQWKRDNKLKIADGVKYRIMRDGAIGRYVDGALVERIYPG